MRKKEMNFSSFPPSPLLISLTLPHSLSPLLMLPLISFLFFSIGAEMLTDDSRYTAIPEWVESTRDFMNFSKRKGDLPVQIEGDIMDIRGTYVTLIASNLLLLSLIILLEQLTKL